ncbi:putative hydro-lyase [Oceanidesulfovibrio indonesiensis]|uniref:Putative hydro-lyase n=1 Tax=Oceanidesulfovibrio indonesiensis TaxID=54767 RepID=A0A7M3MBZ4_9BACT|nr:putative hydro-lyase [Oceanidesulfovibrio indonesiensis]TVM15374.1 putative hydro-lyase [Oceanidesulfovibrio indonesiensis]
MQSYVTPAHVREACREQRHVGPTPGFCPGHAQANVVILPKEHAWDFLLLCQRNPTPLPLLEVYEPGDPVSRTMAPGSDIRTDCPRYIVQQSGETREATDISDLWRDDLVTFLLGCSFTFEAGLIEAGVPVRHMEESCNVPMYRTNVPLDPAGIFSGPMVVSMRPVPSGLVPAAVMATARFPAVHGAPVWVGNPQGLGIADVNTPDFGDSVTIREGELPVFWACGVSGLSAVQTAGVDFAVTHAPGHMLVLDVKDSELGA